ncbi:phosphotyrosine protein phosphatase [Dactylosporangium sp. NPDC000555]|uniref:arsenate reductase/protein-tyrosine-phosphatase family protein n=1 Tax=Dactylosporangium sp. NPDC000555 TaxID=3154260 RepID=UPI00332C3F42
MAPFSVLCVCMGNICRSPMAERLLVADALALGGDSDRLYVHGAGTGGWHAGAPMDPQAAKQVLNRGGDVSGFRARRLLAEHVDASDLILTATIEQVDFVTALRPDAAPRTFVFGEFGRLIRGAEPPRDHDVYERGVALVEAADAARAGRPPVPSDELDDPWGRPDAYFSRVADEIHATTKPLAEALFAA